MGWGVEQAGRKCFCEERGGGYSAGGVPIFRTPALFVSCMGIRNYVLRINQSFPFRITTKSIKQRNSVITLCCTYHALCFLKQRGTKVPPPRCIPAHRLNGHSPRPIKSQFRDALFSQLTGEV